MLSAFIAAISNAGEVIQSKRVLKDYNMPAKTLLSLGSTLIFFVMCFLFVFWGSVDVVSLNSTYFLLFGGVILVGFIYNYLFYYSLKRGELCDVEPVAMLAPLATMLLAIIVYPDERNLYILIPAIVASFVLAYSRIERYHFKINKYSLAMLGFVLLFAVEANLVKPLLEVFSPVALYTIRIGILSAMFLLLTKPNLKKVKKDSFWQVLLIALIVAVEYSAFYYAISSVGIVVTSLIMLLAPVLILISSRFLFKEKMTIKKAISSAIILACIVVAILIS